MTSTLPAPLSSASLVELETELIELFVRLAGVVGLPRSVAEIYGVLFASPTPLTMDDVIGKLHLSRGAVSQGLRQLRRFGAIAPVSVPGDRRTYLQVEDNLRKIAAGFLQEQVLPQLEDWPQRLRRIQDLSRDLPASDGFPPDRARKLDRWHQRTRDSIPVVLDLIGRWE